MIFTIFLLLCQILITTLVIAVVWWYTELFKYYKYLKKYKGPLPLPLVGNAHLLASTTKIIPQTLKYQKIYDHTPIKAMIGPMPRLLITEPKLAEFLLRSTSIIRKSYEYNFFHPWLGKGLLTSWGPKWKRQRRLITPAFHFQILEQFIGIFETQSNILIEKLRKEADGGAFDIFPYATLCTLDAICEAAMGISVNAQKYSDSDYVRSVKEICKVVTMRAISPMKMLDWFFKFFKDYKVQKTALGILHGYTNNVISKRRQELLNDLNGTVIIDGDTVVKRRLAFLDLLLQCNVDGSPLSDESIREEVDTFMFEGHDTTSSAISFTLYSLSKNPDVQEKIIEELRTLFADDKNKSPTNQDLQEMKYLDQVIKEAMRLYPPVPTYSRVLEEDVEYDNGILPKGLTLTLTAVGLHRNPYVFPNPDKFDPERFSPENSVGRSPYAYVPFSAGPRNCIGQRFAMLEIKSIVSKVLRNYEILPVPGHEPELALEAILKSANGLNIRLKNRVF